MYVSIVIYYLFILNNGPFKQCVVRMLVNVESREE